MFWLQRLCASIANDFPFINLLIVNFSDPNLSSALKQNHTILQSGLLFNIAATGTPANINLTLCLNGNGPLSCQNYTVSSLSLNITTTRSLIILIHPLA